MHTSSSGFLASSRRLHRLFIICLAGMLGVSPGGAADFLQAALLNTRQLKRLSVEELLQQEVVSVSRQGESLGQAAGNIFLIAGRSPRGVGATTLPELLRLAPALFVAQSSSYHWGINARGFMRTNAHSNKLLVLVDGRTVYSPLFSNVFWDSTDVFLPDLDGIEVISGPSGSNWGSNAVNGVINVRSLSARDTLGGLLQVTGGTNGIQAAARQGFRFGENGAARVYAKRTEREGTFSAAGVDDGRDEWHATQAGFRADWGAPATGEMTLQGEWSSGKFGAQPMPEALVDNGHLIARWARTLSADAKLWVRAYYDYTRRENPGLLTETTRTADIELQHTTKFSDHQHLLLGANYRRISDHADDTLFFAILPAQLNLDLVALFAQHEARWHDNSLRLTTGLRLEHNDFTDWEYQPTMRLAWHREYNTFWLAAARATRTPSRLEKGFFAPETPPFIIGGGPDFTSEVLRSYEAGWRGQVAPGAVVTATLYFHDYDQLRTVEPDVPVVQGNGGEGRSYGFELLVDYDVTRVWRFRAGGFVMNQVNRLKPGSADTEGGWGEASFPGYQFFLRNNFRLTPKVDLWLSLRHIGEVPAYENGGGVVPAYTELDARFGWQVRPDLEVSLIGRSLLDASHPEIGGLGLRREIPRSVVASVRWDF